MRELLVPIFQHGECKYESPSVKEIAEFCRQEKETLWDETKHAFVIQKGVIKLMMGASSADIRLNESVNI